ARGWAAGVRTGRSLVFQHVRPFGWIEMKAGRIDPRIALQPGEAQLRGMSEAVGQLHRQRQPVAEADPDPRERGVLRPGRCQDPRKAVALAIAAHLKVALEIIGAEQDRGGRGGNRALELLDRDLVQVRVVHGQPGAIADDRLLIRAGVNPPEAAGTGELEGPVPALGPVRGWAFTGGGLREVAARTLRLRQEIAQLLQRIALRSAKREG